MAVHIGRPGEDEYAPFYARYVERVQEGDVVELLERQANEVAGVLRGLPAETAEHRYAPEKWSVKEVVGHLNDAERIFAYRALRIARGDQTPLPGWDENAYVPTGNFGARSLESLLDEWADLRRATLWLFRHLDAEAFARRGTANNHGISVRALAYVTAGHTAHHLEILRTRYLAGAAAPASA